LAGTGLLTDVPATIDSSGNLTAVNSLAGSVIATKAQQEAATSSVNVVTPSTQQFHPSAVQAHAVITGSSGAIQSSYNVSGVVRNSAGDYTITFSTAFAAATYGCDATSENGGSPLRERSVELQTEAEMLLMSRFNTSQSQLLRLPPTQRLLMPIVLGRSKNSAFMVIRAG
jgi:hypothetical protein